METKVTSVTMSVQLTITEAGVLGFPIESVPAEALVLVRRFIEGGIDRGLVAHMTAPSNGGLRMEIVVDSNSMSYKLPL